MGKPIQGLLASVKIFNKTSTFRNCSKDSLNSARFVIFIQYPNKQLFYFAGGQNGNPETGETPSTSGAGVAGGTAAKRLKLFPEESVPDLIRLVKFLFSHISKAS